MTSYFGGKARIAKRLVEVMAPTLAGRYVWEPFCGGLNVTPHLARASLGVFASDANPALVALYQAVRAGWYPPSTLTREEWTAAKSLPDSDPRKAFAGLCSFGGKWFGGYASDESRGRKWIASQRRCVLNVAHSPLVIDCVDFAAIEPTATAYPLALYCDPPYAGTVGIRAYEPSVRTGVGFDSGAFWARAVQWARLVPVFVSEYSAPEGWACILSREQPSTGGRTGTERLFYRGPECWI